MRTTLLASRRLYTNLVLDALIPDILAGMMNRINCRHTFTRKAKIFWQRCSIAGNHPASSNVLDVMKKMARAPHIDCAFRHKNSSHASKYCYITNVDLKNRCPKRTLSLTLELCPACLQKSETIFFAIKEWSDTAVMDACRCHFWILCHEMKSFCSSMPKTKNFRPVVQPYSDLFLPNASALDHFLGGTTKCLVEFAFLSIQCEAGQEAVNQDLVVSFKILGMGSHQTVFKLHKNTPHSAVYNNICYMEHFSRRSAYFECHY